MSVISPLESAIVDAISHNQEIGKKSWLLGEKVYLRVTEDKKGVSRVSWVALNWIQCLARNLFGWHSDTHLFNVAVKLSEDIYEIRDKCKLSDGSDLALKGTVDSLIASIDKKEDVFNARSEAKYKAADKRSSRKEWLDDVITRFVEVVIGMVFG